MPGGETYRFLLRMPHELRARLAQAAEAKGSSLNKEIVNRLEASLREPAPSRRQRGEEFVRRLPMRRPLVALALLAVVAALLAVFAGGDQRSAVAQTRYLKSDPDARPSATGRVGLGTPDSAYAQEVAALAYPSSTLKASLFANARDFFSNHIKGRSKKHPGGWQLVGPSTSTQPAVLNFFDFQASDFQVSGRVTAMAVDPTCDLKRCRLWIAAAGGGIWRNDNALDSHSKWKFLSDGFGSNAIGTLTYDAKSDMLYAGTGEPNASGDSESGVGIYASRNGGNSWDFLDGSFATMQGRSISSIVVDPKDSKTLYVGTARGVRGVSSVTGGAVSLAPDAAPWGLWKSTDGGKHFTFMWDGHASARGINHIEFDASHGTLYAAAFQSGIWRSSNGGSTWEQVFATKDAGDNAARTEFALNTTPDKHTRMYVGDGGADLDGAVPPTSNTGVYRGDSIDTKTSAQLTNGTTNPGFVTLTDPAKGKADPTYDYCDGQCWYDNYVVSPAGHPDMVYLGGSFDYNLYAYPFNNGRAVLLSQDAGKTWSDQTRDNAAPETTGIHPDQHALVVNPANPLQFFEGSDGGVIRSSGQLGDGDPDANCNPGGGRFTTTCHQLLTQVPTRLTTINDGLSTLQFQNAVSNPSDPGTLIGGTQDNGTWLGKDKQSSWNQTIYGDGGVAAFDAKNKKFMMNEFYGQATDVNFQNGDPEKWVIVGAPFYLSGEASAFYKPQIGDPVVSGTFFVGLQHVWRTQDFGGNQADLEANCQEFTIFADTPGCGDFVALGDPSGAGGPNHAGDLTSSLYGGDRQGGYVAAVARTPSDHSTLWAATATGRVFISTNADNRNASKVTFTRLDSLSTASPARFVTGIVIDPDSANRAWITYSGYNANTPSQPGHVFQVDYDPKTKSATWKFIDNGLGPLGDLPVTGIARDDATGTLYVATDFTVLADSPDSNGAFDGNWDPAADGLPQVEVAGVTIDPSNRTLYAATHGRGIWSLKLPDAPKDKGPGKK